MLVKSNEINSKFAMRLQLFGNPEPTPAPNPEPTPTPEPTPQPIVDDGLPKTKEELEKLLGSEADKRVTGALKTAQAKWQAEYEAKLESEKQEAAKLAKLSEAEKQKALLDKQQLEISEKEKQINLREMKLESVKMLSEKGLPVSFVDLLTTSDADSTKLNIDTFDTAFKAALEVAVNDRLKSSGVKPQVGATATDLNTKLEEARKKAITSGRLEDRAAYAKIKNEINQTKK